MNSRSKEKANIWCTKLEVAGSCQLWDSWPRHLKICDVLSGQEIQNSKCRDRNQILIESPMTMKKKKITSEISLLPGTSAPPHLTLQVSCTIDLVSATCFWVRFGFSCLNYSIYKMGTVHSGYLKCVLKDEKWQCSMWKKITK